MDLAILCALLWAFLAHKKYLDVETESLFVILMPGFPWKRGVYTQNCNLPLSYTVHRATKRYVNTVHRAPCNINKTSTVHRATKHQQNISLCTVACKAGLRPCGRLLAGIHRAPCTVHRVLCNGTRALRALCFVTYRLRRH